MRVLDGCNEREVPDVPDATGVAEVMLGLPGFRVVDAEVADDELVITVETPPPSRLAVPSAGSWPPPTTG